MDLVMPVMDGIEAKQKIKEACPDIKVMVLTIFVDQDHVLPAIEAGASGYQLKDIEPDELVNAIRQLVRGEKTLQPKATNMHITSVSQKNTHHSPIDNLTIREKALSAEIANGRRNKEIGAHLPITETTV